MNFSEQVLQLAEPTLEFRYGQSMQDPHDGLSMFGPYGIEISAHPQNLTLGLIGTSDGIGKFITWSKVIQGPVFPGKDNGTGKDLDPHLWPVFPGFEAAFACNLPTEPTWTWQLDSQELDKASRHGDPNKRAFAVVEQYLSAIQLTEKKDETFSLLVCVVPDVVWQNCRPESYVADAIGPRISSWERERRTAGQTNMFDNYNPAIYQYSVDFRRQIKARSMRYGIPIQIIRESTLTLAGPSRLPRRSPPSDLAWNLSTAMYYKAGGKPWRLAGARSGVCYIGIVFRRTDMSIGNRTACCAAQMFLDSGDGIVFLGEYGPWYSPHNKQFHLSREAAEQLLRGVLKTYAELEGLPLTEIFLHCRSGISREEFGGYQAACPSGVKLVGIRVRKEKIGLRMYREGSYPVIRASFWSPDRRTAYLYASGFVPRLRTYPGSEVPIPLRIDIQHGDADIVQVARDILALTKLNYNACRFGASEPVTILFSDSVGEILVSNPTVTERKPKFKFYI